MSERFDDDAASLEGDPECVDWLDTNRFAFGKYALLEGDPALSKSTIMLDIAARGSVGAAMPSGLCHEPFSTLIVGVEDGTRDTLIPRAMAAGADRSRIFHLRSIRGANGREPFTLPTHLDRLDPYVEKLGVRMIVFDPLPSLLERGLSENGNKDVRQALEPLIDWAQERGVLPVGLRHFTKGGTTNPLYRGQGSIAFAALARQVNQVYAGDGGDFILASAKNSLGEFPPSLTYARESVSYVSLGAHDPKGTNSAPRIVWKGENYMTAYDLANAPQTQEERQERTGTGDLWDQLLEEGVNTWKEIKNRAGEFGYSEHAMRKAAAQKGIGASREGFGPGSKVVWRKAGTGLTVVPTGTNGHHPEEDVPANVSFPFGRTPNG